MRVAIIIILGAFMPLMVYPQVHVVDNNPNAPGGTNQYTTLAAAVSAATAGDTIYIVPSGTSYGNLEITKQLTVIGGGFFPDSDDKKTSQVNFVYVRGSAASFSTIKSLYLWDEVVINDGANSGNISGLTIENCYLDEHIESYNRLTDTLNITIRGNIIGRNVSSSIHAIYLQSRISNPYIANNVILGSTSANYGSIHMPNIISGENYIEHNIFLGDGTDYAFKTVTQATINNNIFYGRSPESTIADSSTFAGNLFYNNLSFNCVLDFDDSTLFTVRNFDGGNNKTTDPQFVNLPLAHNWSMLYDLHALDTAVTNREPNIGVYGGSFEIFTSHGSSLPAITSLLGASEIIEGNNLSLEVTAFDYNVGGNIQRIEYFVNGPDPGFGLATDGGIVGPLASPATSTINFNTGALTNGFHIIYVRAQNDQGIWGNYEEHLLYVNTATTSVFPDVTGIEYFFDEDPGYGNGTAIEFSPGTEIEISDIIATTSLSIGFHTLFIRALDGNGNWGLAESRMVFIDNTSVSVIPDITSMEYFFDTDPGYGSGTPFIVSPDSIVDISEAINTEGIEPGFHSLYVRAMDSDNNWGLLEGRLIFIEDASVTVIPDITGIEYFFDTDPGYGLGISLTVTPDSVVTLEELISTEFLDPGFHSFYIRAKDASERWGLLESRLVYIDEASEEAVADITSLEYFFDTDPGYGAGTELTVTTPATVVQLLENISTASLSLGFHTLYLRAKDANNRWGILDSRLIYVDENTITEVSPLTTLEYFFDTDPGYGNATQIPLSQSDSVKIGWNVSSFALGSHLLGVRVKNADDTWSITEMFKFRVYSEGRELDSAALVEIYEKNGGSSWTNKTNWVSANSIDTWFGVSLDAVTGRVTNLQLENNNLTGDLAKEFGYILDLENVNLSNNDLTDTIHSSAVNLINLESLDISNNKFNGLPDLSGISSLNTLRLDSNAFEFGDIEPQIGIANFTYSGQAKLLQGYDSAVNTGQNISLVISTSGANNQYQWFRDSLLIDGANASTFTIPSVGVFDVGDYHVEVTNTVATDVVIVSDIYRLYFDGPTADSLALVAMYDSLGGTTWTNQTNWKTGPVSTWAGVYTDQDSRVRKVTLSSNNLTGILPPRIGDLAMLDTLEVSENNISGPLPAEFLKMTMLDYVDLSNNDIATIPNNIKTAILGITTLAVEGNRLQFGPLETNLAISNFTFIPQDSVLAPLEKTAVIGGKASFMANVTGANNMYQWFKNGTAITGANVDSLVINDIDFTDEGLYQVRVQNSLIGGLTLFTTNTRLVVQGLAADQNALEEFYNTNGGASWTTNTGWLADTIINWHGVVVRDKRVVEVNLPDNNITGELSSRIADLTALEKLDLSGNQLINLPDLTSLSVLASLDVSRNKLEFAPLERNISITGMVYSEQDSVGNGFLDTLAVHSNVKLSGVVSGTSNNYQWYFEETAIDGATLDSLEIPDLTRQDMGKYYVQVTNNLVPDLILTGRIKEILASATISGTITDDDANTITEGGRMILLRITDIGGYDTTALAEIIENGTYIINDVVLDNYQLIAEADTVIYPDHLPTYYQDAIFWEEADTIKLEDNLPNTNIQITIYEDLSLGGEGEISGYIEEEDGKGGKTMKRNRVANAGVSVRRKVRAGRKKLIEKSRILEDTELVGHVKSNKDGRFTFSGLQNDLYYFNVQYPGVPMDSTSFIEIPVGDVAGGRTTSYKEKVEVEALIDKNKIFVRQTNITSVYQNEAYANIKVYPNPAQEHFTIDMQGYQEVFTMTLIDEQGKIILYRSEVEGLLEIRVNSLSKGIYLLRLLNKDSQPVATKRIAIQ